MPVTKITLSVAMRARDVSRPRAEDYAEAAQGEDAQLNPVNPPGSATAKTGEGPPSRRRRRRTRSAEC